MDPVRGGIEGRADFHSQDARLEEVDEAHQNSDGPQVILDALQTNYEHFTMIMETTVQTLLALIGLGGLMYAFLFDRFAFNVLDILPSPFNQRKAVFLAGAVIILVSFAMSYWIAPYHGVLGAVGGWIMLLGSSQWFTLRIERKLFAPVEIRIIRMTMFSGLLIAVLSTGLLYFPSRLSLSTLLLGLALMTMAGRLWWNEDPNYESMVMKHSKRDYS